MKPKSFRPGIAALSLLLASAAGAKDAPAPSPPQLMVLGMVHFANPGRDQINLKVEDVLDPDRQAELETLVAELARYRPTHIAVEWEASDQAGLDKAYADWRAGDHSSRAERSQVAFRLAEKLGLDRVDAIDWQRPPPGDEAAYDFVTWADAHGRGNEFQAALAPPAQDNATLQHDMPCLTVSGWLALVNDPAVQRRNALSYYPIARLGDSTANPGAAWVGGSWHMRNLTIWANLTALAKSPQDRILLLIGAGHRPLVEHFATDSGGFRVVDPLKWLPHDKRKGGGCP